MRGTGNSGPGEHSIRTSITAVPFHTGLHNKISVIRWPSLCFGDRVCPCEHYRLKPHCALKHSRGTARRNDVMRTILACAVVLFASGSFVAGQQAPPAPATQKPRIEREAIRPTGTVDGKDLFTNYCAACHGTGAKGDGPAAAALNKKPADLTKISARNGGTFPATKVSRFIEGAD